MLTRIILAAVLTLGLAGCKDEECSKPPVITQRAVAPDGTILYVAKFPCIRDVYFSSRGTQTSHIEVGPVRTFRNVDDLVPNL